VLGTTFQSMYGGCSEPKLDNSLGGGGAGRCLEEVWNHLCSSNKHVKE
jgi:hypothetical protein